MGLAKIKTESPKLSPEEYLELEREAEVRHEFLDGEIYATAGESLSHSRVCVGLTCEVGNKLKGTLCEPLSSNMKVRTTSASLFSYPDLTIICGEPQFHDVKKDVLINPQIIFEVLSPFTENYDRTTKFMKYRMGNPTMTDYILVSQDKIFIEHFTKQTDNNWNYSSYNKLDSEFLVQSINCSLSLTEIYDRVEFEDSDEDDLNC